MNNNFFEVLRPGINTTFQDKDDLTCSIWVWLLADVWITSHF